MVRVKSGRGGRLFLVVPAAFSIWYAAAGNVLALPLFLLSVPFAVAMTRELRGRESVGAFALLSLASIPLNLRLMAEALRTELLKTLTSGWLITGILWGILLYALLFSLEQIAVALVTRLVWPKQRPAPGRGREQETETE